MGNKQSNENEISGVCCTFSIFSRVFWYVLLGGILAFIIGLFIAIGGGFKSHSYHALNFYYIPIIVPIVLIVCN